MALLTIDDQLYGFSVRDGDTVTLEVVDGTVDFSTQTSGPFVPEGRLTAGEVREFDRPGLLHADAPAHVEITYPQPDPPVDDNPPEGQTE
jgi:hypothetical protein